jgi:uncharacterized coiled-coil protein SlyX
MDEQKILNNIESRLKKIDERSFDQLSSYQKEYLINIEIEIYNRLKLQNINYQNIKDKKINISSIAKSVNIARKTIYNNKILKDYINYAENIYNENYTEYKLCKLEEKITEQKNIIDKMVERDITIENLKIEIDQLSNELKVYKRENELFQIEKNNLLGEINNLKKRSKLKKSMKVIKNPSKL